MESNYPPASQQPHSFPEEALGPLFSNPWKRLPERFQIKTAILARIFTMVFSFVSFSLMVACHQKTWRGRSFSKSMEHRFCMTNIIVFGYSAFQASASFYPIVFGENFFPLPWKDYFDLALDQVLAYLQIAVGASATAVVKKTRNYSLANAAISMAFLAFAGLAISALVSAFTLFRHYSYSSDKDTSSCCVHFQRCSKDSSMPVKHL